jgi:2-dehydropantoate 2-reductase
MKFCIFGAGAIGGYLAVELALSGQDVCVVARGAHLEAIQRRGLTLKIHGAQKVAKVAADPDPRVFGRQDVVICALKAHQAFESAATFAPLLGTGTSVVTAMNGIPWWYSYKAGGPLEGRQLRSIDSDGRQWNIIGPQRAIGCVVEPACEVIAPGVIAHRQFNRFIIGEPDGTRSARVQELSNVLTQAAFDAPVRDNIRWDAGDAGRQ